MARPQLPDALWARLLIGCALVVALVTLLDLVGPSAASVAERALTTAWAAKAAQEPSQPSATIADPEGICPSTATAAATLPASPDRPVWTCVRTEAGIALRDAGGATIAEGRPIGARSLVGPLLAVILVLLLRRPATALVIAVVAATMIDRPPLEGATALLAVTRDTLIGGDNQLVLIFTIAMLGMVHIGIDSGAYGALARAMAGGAARPSPRRARMATTLLGLVIFFDDYANSLVVGGSMRDTCDRAGVSRAKLAYLVDATSAAVAGVALVSTWVGFEVGLLGDLRSAFTGVAASPYGIFVALLPYRFYCLATIAAALIFAWTGRDFGPMRRAEHHAASATTQVPAESANGAKVRDALWPVFIVLGVVVAANIGFGLHKVGATDASVVDVFVAGADVVGLKALALGGVLGLLVAGAAGARAGLGVAGAARSALRGVAGMAPVLVLLLAAMSMRAATTDAGTPLWLAALLGESAGAALPLAAFLVSALVAFLTGSSWATMGILLPVVVPLAAPLAAAHPAWLLAATAAVLDGAIFGDHCSPLSDTTVMSSAAAGVSHDEHVWTQIPYALLVMVVVALFGYIGVSVFDLAPWQGLLLSVGCLAAVIRLVGRPQPPVDVAAADGNP